MRHQRPGDGTRRFAIIACLNENSNRGDCELARFKAGGNKKLPNWVRGHDLAQLLPERAGRGKLSGSPRQNCAVSARGGMGAIGLVVGPTTSNIRCGSTTPIATVMASRRLSEVEGGPIEVAAKHQERALGREPQLPTGYEEKLPRSPRARAPRERATLCRIR